MNANETLTPEEIGSWTLPQQIETLSRIVRIVMARQSTPTLEIPPSMAGEPDSKRFLLAEIPRIEPVAFAPTEGDAELDRRLRLAADPRNRLEMTEQVLNQICD